MKLLIDIGNTRIKSALSSGQGLYAHRSETWQDKDLDQLFQTLWPDTAPSQIIVSNVAGERIAGNLRQWAKDNLGQAVEYIKTSAKAGGLTCAYPQPEQLGVDRWVAIQAAISLSADAVFVIDCGTATTIDLVTADRQHRGGAIMPGIDTMRRALAGNTARLGVPEGHITAFADNTRDAIAGGTAYALAGAIDRLAEEARERFNEPLQAIITGGEANLVLPLLKLDAQHHPDLVLIGLDIIADRKNQNHSDQGLN